MPGNVHARHSGDAAAKVEALPDRAFVVVMTHSHPLDLAIVHAALAAGRFDYVGLIGSRSKRAPLQPAAARSGNRQRSNHGTRLPDRGGRNPLQAAGRNRRRRRGRASPAGGGDRLRAAWESSAPNFDPKSTSVRPPPRTISRWPSIRAQSATAPSSASCGVLCAPWTASTGRSRHPGFRFRSATVA